MTVNDAVEYRVVKADSLDRLVEAVNLQMSGKENWQPIGNVTIAFTRLGGPREAYYQAMVRYA